MRTATIILSSLVVASANVPNVILSKDVEMPMLAFGTSPTSYKECTVQAGVEQWLRLGGRHIDTADLYGTQPDVGRALATSGVPRKEVFITTKITGPIGKINATDKIINTALPQLGVDYIDLVLIHFPCLDLSKTDCPDERAARLDTWAGLAALRDQGKIRAIGVSNFGQAQVVEIVAFFLESPAVNQVQYHLASHDDVLRVQMKNVGTVLEAWSSLGGPTAQGATISLGDARLKAVAARYNASTAQVVLRWETQKGVVPVTDTCTEAHAIGDLSSFNINLSQDDIVLLDAMMPLEQVIV